MTSRDKAIIANLERFRCLTRDDVAELHFPGLRDPVKAANDVLLRLRREGLISCSKERRKYVYFPVPGIKKDSAKIGHFLSIAEFYRQLRRHELPHTFEVEPKLGGKGLPEPDVFAIWKGVPWYVEIQRSVYSEKQMTEKLNRYEKYYISGEWERVAWQLPHKKLFPYVWIVGVGRYDTGNRAFRVMQGGVEDLIKRAK